MRIVLVSNQDEINDKRSANFVAMYFLIQAANLLVKYYIGNFTAWSLISKAILAVFLLIAIPVILRLRLKEFLIVEFFMAMAFFLTLLAGTSGRQSDFFTIVFNSLLVYIPLGLCVLSIKDYSILQRQLYSFGWVTQIILLFLSSRLILLSSEYQMSIGYALVLQMFFFLIHFMNKKKWYDLVIIISDLFFILILGSRGPLIVIAIYILFQILHYRKLRYQNTFWILSLISTSIILGAYYEQFFLLINQFINNLGVSSRTVSFILKGTFTSTSSRNDIYERTFSLIKEHPILGMGITGGWHNSEYPHNIFLEFILSFGIFFGLIFSVLWLGLLLNGIRQKAGNKQSLAYIFIALSVSLLFSGSFILDQYFFITIALCYGNGISSVSVK